MAGVINSPEDILNIALVKIGYKMNIGSIWEGSPASKYALTIYSQTRDDLLRAGNYHWAERNEAATLLKSAPAGGYFPPTAWDGTVNPPPQWRFEYAYPPSCLRVRSIRPSPLFTTNMDPKPINFGEVNDNYYTPPRKVICCNVPNAMLKYTGQVTDPLTFEATFIEDLAAELGRRLAPVLMNLDAAKMAAMDSQQAGEIADRTQG